MANGFAAIAPKDVQKLLRSPILKAKALLDIVGNTIDRRAITEQDAAKPFKGELWVEFELVYGHFNGPKRLHVVKTNGNDFVSSTGDPLHHDVINFIKEELDMMFDV